MKKNCVYDIIIIFIVFVCYIEVFLLLFLYYKINNIKRIKFCLVYYRFQVLKLKLYECDLVKVLSYL